MALVLSYRGSKGQFLSHSTLLGTVGTRVATAIALVVIDRASRVMLDATVGYLKHRAAAAAAAKAKAEAEATATKKVLTPDVLTTDTPASSAAKKTASK